MKSIDGHAAGFQPVSQLEGEIEVHELGGAVDVHTPIGTSLPLQVVEVKSLPSLGMAPRRDHHHSGWRTLSQAFEQKMGEEKVAEMVHLELHLQSVLGHLSLGEHRAGIELEDVNVIKPLLQLPGASLDGG